MRIYGLCLLLPAVIFVATACGDNKSVEQQTEVVQEVPPPVVDSAQLQVVAYEQQLVEAQDDISKTLRQLNRLSTQLQDSIDGTQVPPQIQEETINNYRNKLHEVRQVQASLKQWQDREIKASDSLSSEERKAFLEDQIQQLERLMQETQQVRREAQSAMQDSDQEAY